MPFLLAFKLISSTKQILSYSIESIKILAMLLFTEYFV